MIHATPRRGVTLVEVLVTIAVAAVLTLILILSLRGVRGQTLAIKDLHNLRLSAQDMLLWSHDNDHKFLNFVDPTSSLFRTVNLGLESPSFNLYCQLYLAQSINWAQYLQVGLGQPTPADHWDTAYRPQTVNIQAGSSLMTVERPRFEYSPTMLTSPELWTESPPATNSLECAPYFSVVRLSNVRFPSDKGMLCHRHVPEPQSTIHVAFVDGSAAAHPTDSLKPPAGSPTSRTGSPGHPVLHTMRGFEGADR